MLRGILLAVPLALALPAAAQTSTATAAGPQLPAGYLRVPLIGQATSFSCGPAALLGILRYWKAFDGHETSLYPLLGATPKDGTTPAKLEEGARHFGLRAELREGLAFPDLESALSRGETVILDIQAWPENDSTPGDWNDNWEDGHYVVLVGMDRSFVYVMDPSLELGYGYIPRAELLGRWHDYETEGGKRREYLRTGVVISGQARISAYPAALEPVR